MGSYGYQVTREMRRRYDRRDLYFKDRAGRAPDPQLCQVMEEVVGNPPLTRTPGSEWKGFPWLTLVLGSGCLELPNDPRLTPESLARGVRETLAAELGPTRDHATYGTDPFSEQAERFTAELVRNRTHPHLRAPGEPADETSPVPPIAARLVLVATLLTRLYFLAKGVGDSPVSRWDGGEARFGRNQRTFWAGRAIEALVQASLDQIRAVRHQLDGPALIVPEIAKPVNLLLEDIADDIEPSTSRMLQHVHLRLVTESAWYLLTHNTSIYPGWTDLLLGLMLREDRSQEDKFTRTRPQYWNLQTVPEKVRALHFRATERSWATLTGSDDAIPSASNDTVLPDQPSATRGRVYAQAADVLWAQARVLRKSRHSECPPASSFVTSFDIELEMALWLSSTRLNDDYWVPEGPELSAPTPGLGAEMVASGRSATKPPFYVVVPVHVFRFKDDDQAALCWLRGEVHPDRSLASEYSLQKILRPERWHLLTPDQDTTHLLDGPHVVHLSGCPLFSLPDHDRPEDLGTIADLVADLRAVGVNVDAEKVDFQHAVTVDEYLAFRQSEAEHFWSAFNSPSQSRGLHSFLFGSSKSRTDPGQNPRFWMALGVPVSDTTIRQRVVSQITLRNVHSMADPAPDSSSSPTRSTESIGRLGPELFPQAAEVVEATRTASTGDGGDRGTGRSDQHREINGVVVNRRINDDEASILYWLGLDVVNDDSRNFIGDLEHYAKHLSQVNPRCSHPTVRCPLVDKEGEK